MKLAIDCRMSGKSGIGTFLDSIIPFFILSGTSILFLGLPEKKKEELEQSHPSASKNFTFLPCSIKNFSLKEMLAFPSSLFREINSCDAYFSPYCNIPGRIFSRGIKIPVYATIHDIIFLDMPDIAGKTGTFIRKQIYKRAIRLSKGVFTVSEFSKERIIKKLDCKKKLTVVYNGVPLYNEEENSAEVREKSKTILFVGNIKKHKGLATLIPAFIKFRRDLSLPEEEKPQLLIVGSKENFRTADLELQELISSAEKNNIVFTGFLPDEELKHLLASAKILVQPSLYEGFGIPPLQALYSGTKAIISDIPVFKEIYADLPVCFFKTGSVDDLAQKLTQVYSDDSPLPKFKKIYSYKNTANKILDSILEDVRG
ncbi:MAG: glycosyltransferase family 4 protein [Treponema sp.]|nr:glycosyltransferase family 4 protein [Treponema sp.]